MKILNCNFFKFALGKLIRRVEYVELNDERIVSG